MTDFLHAIDSAQIHVLSAVPMTDTTSGDGLPRKVLLFEFDDVVRAIGGVGKLAKLTHCNRSTVWLWKSKAGAFPAKHYHIMREVLFEQGYVADLRLWDFTGVRKKSVADVAA